MAVDQKLDRRCDALGEQVDSGIAETQAMIRFSHTELERRFALYEGSERAFSERRNPVTPV